MELILATASGYGGAESADADRRQSLAVDPVSDASLVLHVIEELFQHLGHCEIAADALLAP